MYASISAYSKQMNKKCMNTYFKKDAFMNKNILILMLFLMIPTSIYSFGLDDLVIEENADQIFDALQELQKTYKSFIDQALLPDTKIDTIQTIMFNLMHNKKLITEGIKQDEYELLFYEWNYKTKKFQESYVKQCLNEFIKALNNLYKTCRNNFRILGYDLDEGSLKIGLKYTKPDGSSYWISPEQFKKIVSRKNQPKFSVPEELHAIKKASIHEEIENNLKNALANKEVQAYQKRIADQLEMQRKIPEPSFKIE